MFRNNQSYTLTGTTTPIFVPRSQEPSPVRPGQDYFFVQIHSAQAAFHGPIWERVKNLIVATQVSIHHPTLGQDNLRALQRTREVKRDRAEQLGLKPNLIGLVPAVMPDLSVSIDFILDKENSLRDLSGLINSDSFLAAVSLAPGAALVAKTISGLAGKIIETFVPAQERQPILQFSGEFNMTDDCLKDGYYVILGTRDNHNPLPSPLPHLQVKDGQLLADGDRVTQLSYVVIDVHRTPVRTRDLNEGAVWDMKLREAEDEARRVGIDPLADDDERQSAWEKCRTLIKEAQTLLRSDPNYHRHEAENIVKAALNQCMKGLRIKPDSRRGGIVKAARGEWQPDMQAERALFNISLDEDLDATMGSYAEEVAAARRVIEEAGLR